MPHEGERGDRGFECAPPVAREGQTETTGFLVEAIGLVLSFCLSWRGLNTLGDRWIREFVCGIVG